MNCGYCVVLDVSFLKNVLSCLFQSLSLFLSLTQIHPRTRTLDAIINFSCRAVWRHPLLLLSPAPLRPHPQFSGVIADHGFVPIFVFLLLLSLSLSLLILNLIFSPPSLLCLHRVLHRLVPLAESVLAGLSPDPIRGCTK